MKKMLLALLVLLSFSFNAVAAVNLNTATQAELESVKGIGPVKAQAIIDYRKQNGNFKSVDDLDNVKGFGDKSVAKLKSEFVVNGSSPAAPVDAKKQAQLDNLAKARAAKAEKAAAAKAAAEKK